MKTQRTNANVADMIMAERRTLRALQDRVENWLQAAFSKTLATTSKERSQRFIEEALELVQAREMTKEEVGLMVDYVYSRPVGETRQEVGGTMITLGALCWQAGVDLEDAAFAEMDRIESPKVMEKIRAKQNRKSAILGITALEPGDDCAPAE